MSNALLPPMDKENFHATFTYRLLAGQDDYRDEVCRFLSVSRLEDLEFVANPHYGFYTPYDEDNFDECLAYLQQAEQATGLGKLFSLVETNIGRQVICYQENGHAVGLLSRK